MPGSWDGTPDIRELEASLEGMSDEPHGASAARPSDSLDGSPPPVEGTLVLITGGANAAHVGKVASVLSVATSMATGPEDGITARLTDGSDLSLPRGAYDVLVRATSQYAGHPMCEGAAVVVQHKTARGGVEMELAVGRLVALAGEERWLVDLGSPSPVVVSTDAMWFLRDSASKKAAQEAASRRSLMDDSKAFPTPSTGAGNTSLSSHDDSLPLSMQLANSSGSGSPTMTDVSSNDSSVHSPLQDALPMGRHSPREWQQSFANTSDDFSSLFSPNSSRVSTQQHQQHQHHQQPPQQQMGDDWSAALFADVAPRMVDEASTTTYTPRTAGNSYTLSPTRSPSPSPTPSPSPSPAAHNMFERRHSLPSSLLTPSASASPSASPFVRGTPRLTPAGTPTMVPYDGSLAGNKASPVLSSPPFLQAHSGSMAPRMSPPVQLPAPMALPRSKADRPKQPVGRPPKSANSTPKPSMMFQQYDNAGFMMPPLGLDGMGGGANAGAAGGGAAGAQKIKVKKRRLPKLEMEGPQGDDKPKKRRRTLGLKKSQQLIGHLVRVIGGKFIGKEGIITSSGHGFFCIQATGAGAVPGAAGEMHVRQKDLIVLDGDIDLSGSPLYSPEGSPLRSPLASPLQSPSTDLALRFQNFTTNSPLSLARSTPGLGPARPPASASPQLEALAGGYSLLSLDGQPRSQEASIAPFQLSSGGNNGNHANNTPFTKEEGGSAFLTVNTAAGTSAFGDDDSCDAIDPHRYRPMYPTLSPMNKRQAHFSSASRLPFTPRRQFTTAPRDAFAAGAAGPTNGPQTDNNGSTNTLPHSSASDASQVTQSVSSMTSQQQIASTATSVSASELTTGLRVQIPTQVITTVPSFQANNAPASTWHATSLSPQMPPLDQPFQEAAANVQPFIFDEQSSVSNKPLPSHEWGADLDGREWDLSASPLKKRYPRKPRSKGMRPGQWLQRTVQVRRGKFSGTRGTVTASGHGFHTLSFEDGTTGNFRERELVLLGPDGQPEPGSDYFEDSPEPTHADSHVSMEGIVLGARRAEFTAPQTQQSDFSFSLRANNGQSATTASAEGNTSNDDASSGKTGGVSSSNQPTVCNMSVAQDQDLHVPFVEGGAPNPSSSALQDSLFEPAQHHNSGLARDDYYMNNLDMFGAEPDVGAPDFSSLFQ